MDGLTRANSPLFLASLLDKVSIGLKIGAAALISLGLSLDNNTRRDGPAQRCGGPDGQAASLTRRIVAVGWPVPLVALVSDTHR